MIVIANCDRVPMNMFMSVSFAIRFILRPREGGFPCMCEWMKVLVVLVCVQNTA